MNWIEVKTIFNNREIATAIWVAIISFICLFKKETRKPFLGLFTAFANEKLIAWIFLMAVYISLSITFLWEVSFWETSLLKDSFFWFLFSAILLGFQLATDQKDEKSFKQIVLGNLGIVIFVEYFVGLYSFSLITELLIIPSMACVVIMKVVAEREEKTLIVAKVMDWVQIIFGLTLITLTVKNFISDSKSASETLSIKKFLLPIFLLFLFLPFLFLQKLFLYYENIFLRLDMGREKDEYLKNSSKIVLFRTLGIDFRKLRLFYHKYAFKLLHINSLNELNEILLDFYKNFHDAKRHGNS